MQEETAKAETREAAGELQRGDTDAARDRLNRAKKEQELATKRLKQVDKRYNLLTLRCCVIFPGAILLGAAALSVVAESLLRGDTDVGILFWLAMVAWFLSLVLVGVAVYRLIRALLVVQDVSLSSDEVALQRTKEALKAALLEVEEARRPELEFMWKCEETPLRVRRSEKFEIQHTCRVSRGDVARNLRIAIHIPPGFAFEGEDGITVQDADHSELPSYFTTDSVHEALTPGINALTKTKIVAPDDDGEYTLFGEANCEGFRGERMPLEVVVSGELSVPEKA